MIDWVGREWGTGVGCAGIIEHEECTRSNLFENAHECNVILNLDRLVG